MEYREGEPIHKVSKKDISNEHIKRLEQSLIEVHKRGLILDLGDAHNILYDQEIGFSLLDLNLRYRDFSEDQSVGRILSMCKK